MNACVDLGIVFEGKGSSMARRRRQFTLGWLMILVAVCGFEVFNYRRGVERKAEMKLAVSITDNIYLYSFGVVIFWVMVWVASSRIRAANSVATNKEDQMSDRGGD
jgi:hypothetical protein